MTIYDVFMLAVLFLLGWIGFALNMIHSLLHRKLRP